MLFKEGYTLFRGTGYGGNCKDGSDGGADKIGVIQICQRIADNDACGIGSIGTTEDSSKVAGLLNALQNDKERLSVYSPTLLLKQ
jgi:hypothetical protein